MVAMAIMVHSFRDSFEVWLAKLLPADIQFRSSSGGDTSLLSPAVQARIGALDGVARADFRRTQSLLLRADRPAVTLIARNIARDRAAETLPLIREAQPTGAATALPPAWISEAIKDLYGYQPGQILSLPLAGRRQDYFIAGLWRDYVRSSGAIVIRRQDYIAASGDAGANEGSVWRDPHHDAASLIAAIRASLDNGDTLEILSSQELRERSLIAFDRAFLVTYALEAISVVIGLLGVSVGRSSVCCDTWGCCAGRCCGCSPAKGWHSARSPCSTDSSSGRCSVSSSSTSSTASPFTGASILRCRGGSWPL
jgi:putative ABC transport system permease protein